MTTFQQLQTLFSAIFITYNCDFWQEDTALIGNIPEFDSIAIVQVITAIEEQFDVILEDDEINADMFETFGALVHFVDEKVTA